MSSQQSIESIYEHMVRHNMHLLEQFPCPRLEESGVTVSHIADDELADVQVLLERGYGNLASLVCWRVAELRRDYAIRISIIVEPTPGPAGIAYLALRFPDTSTVPAHVFLDFLDEPSCP